MNNQDIETIRYAVRHSERVLYQPDPTSPAVRVAFITDDMAPEGMRGFARLDNGKRVELAQADADHFSIQNFVATRVPNPRHSPDVVAEFDRLEAERNARTDALPKIREEGERALYRLFTIANGYSGQCRYVAAVLLGLYNGRRFRFDLTDLRCIDPAIFDDCMAVLKMDAQHLQEVHMYFENGQALFEGLATRWGIKDYLNETNSATA
jgi:hypothetical protein